MTSTHSDLPVIPLRRNAQCPLAPPAEFATWRRQARPSAGDVERPADLGRKPLPGHQGRAGRPAAVGGNSPGPVRCGQQQRGARGFRANRRSRASSVAAHDDQPVHLPAHRGDAAADPGIGRQIPRRNDQQGAARRHRARLRPAGPIAGDRAAAGGASRGSRALSAQHLRRIGRELHRRGTGARLHRDVRLHPGVSDT